MKTSSRIRKEHKIRCRFCSSKERPRLSAITTRFRITRLEFDAKLSVLGKGEKPGLDGNLIIEGDNLVALKALLPTHAGRIKCIYIDPPYNTGNEGWVYNDNLTQPQFKEWIGQTVGKEGEDATRHDKWCCMMYPRLAASEGTASRRRSNLHQHRRQRGSQSADVLMDEIFGAENLIERLVWKKELQAEVLKNAILLRLHEYILCYSKDSRPNRPSRIKS